MANKPISRFEELETLPDDAVLIVSRDGKCYGITVGMLRQYIIKVGGVEDA